MAETDPRSELLHAPPSLTARDQRQHHRPQLFIQSSCLELGLLQRSLQTLDVSFDLRLDRVMVVEAWRQSE
jgi:hypothetical protein